VVRAFDLDVEAGELVALLGPTGAGKTTVLETVSGVLPALRGSVLVDGKAIRSVHHAAALGVGYLREGRGLFSQLTTWENLFIRVRNRRAVDAVLRDYPAISHLVHRRVGLLSGGEQQILALACALSQRPRLLLIDEMTMGLAPVVVTHMMARVRKAACEGIGVLFVEQHLRAALDLADRGVVLRHGEVVMRGSSDVLSDRMSELHDSYFDVAFPTS
jgi:branched-chain amino acid transport system ATP-binding protein